MADLLNIGSSALYAATKALDIAGHNIANVGTEGYSRQRVDQSARPGGSVSRLDTGGGVVINGTQRLSDALVETRLVRDGAEVARLTSFSGLASRADALLSSPESGLATVLNAFFGGLQRIAADPGSTAARQAALGDAQTLVDRFHSLAGELGAMDAEINQRLGSAVESVNQLATAIAKLNRSIALAGANTPADLLDARNTLVQQLSEQVGITTLAQDDGSLNVFTSGGQSLVVGEKVNPLGVADDRYRPGRLEITSGGAAVTGQLGGGAMGGLLDARRTLVDPALQKLGRVAVALSTAINTVQGEGVRQDGAVGTALFTPLSGRALAAADNRGSATLAVGYAAVGALSGEDYLLRATGSGWQLSRAATGEPVSFTGSGSSGDPFIAEGFSLTLSGSAVAGDSFRISPTRDAAGALQLATTDPRHFAAAARLSSSAALTNASSARPAAPVVLDASDPQLATPVTLTFTSSTTVQIGSGPSVSFTPGEPLRINGWSLGFSGTPQAGDRFSVEPTPAGSSDNGNALALTAIAQRALLDSGRSTLAAANSALVTATGATAQQVATAQRAAEAVRAQSQSARDAVSGVNLDEEAANLVRYQQAYQAAAQVVATASTLFDALLAATRR